MGEWKLQKAVDGVSVTTLADGNTQVSLHLEQGEPVYFCYIAGPECYRYFDELAEATEKSQLFVGSYTG